MDGYSVTEAASVLGVPIERVWELLARGVLAGAPEGETGMRVFLQPRPAAPPVASEAPPANGGGEPERELSPFRELLTEFRNLTERYGQALLALGESRGEVAALRSRVDMLETRMDLGLPGPGAQRMAPGWAGAGQTYGFDQSVIPTAPAASAEATAAEESAEAEEHRARPRGPRRATESFAEALARAEDPSPPELPRADAVDSVAAARHEPEAAEAVLPRELPAAEPVPVADEASTIGEPQADPASDAAHEDQGAAGPEEAAPEAAAPEVEAAPEEAVPEAAAPEVEAAPETPAVTEADEPVGEPAEPMTWDSDRYSTAIEEPDWFEAEAEADEPEPVPAQPAAEGEAPEETLFWLREATADEPQDPEILPGSSELDSALEALGAIGGNPASDQPDPSPPPTSPAVSAQAEPETATPPSPPSALPPSALRYRPVAPPGPTGRAYRRLRRIFPD